MPIGTKERRRLFHVLRSGATCSTDITGITVYASQHCLSGNTVFDSSFPGFPGSGFGITTSTFRVCLPCLLELVGIVLFGRAIFSESLSDEPLYLGSMTDSLTGSKE
jgi:hypothetical protein